MEGRKVKDLDELEIMIDERLKAFRSMIEYCKTLGSLEELGIRSRIKELEALRYMITIGGLNK